MRRLQPRPHGDADLNRGVAQAHPGLPPGGHGRRHLGGGAGARSSLPAGGVPIMTVAAMKLAGEAPQAGGVGVSPTFSLGWGGTGTAIQEVRGNEDPRYRRKMPGP